MQLRIGSYTFPANSVEIDRSIEAILSDKRIPIGERHVWAVSGELIQEGQAAVAFAEQQLALALGRQYQDAYFLRDDGQVVWSLINSTSVDGVKVLNYHNPPATHQFATGIPLEFTIEATYAYGPDQFPVTGGNLSFTESLRISGGGPRYAFIETVNSVPIKYLVNPKTVCRATQSGSATSLFLPYPVAPGPIWPADELEDLREIEKAYSVSPDGMPQFTTTWRYEFAAAAAVAGDPSRR